MAESSIGLDPVKLVILPRTRAGLTKAGLRQHLEKVHGPMVVAEPDVSGRFSGYVHHYVQDAPSSLALAPLQDRDAVTVIRLPSMTDLASSKANAAYRENIGPDEDNFREIIGSVALLADEVAIVPGADDAPLKLFVFRTATSKQCAGWDEKIAHLHVEFDLHGAAMNISRPIEGTFPYSQFDEIGLTATSDLSGLAASIVLQAHAHFGAVDTKMLLTEPVRFV
ncbi:ethD domain protein (plasmid) [Blastomonas sp. RAC04]|uniref:EthD domain-containing protein n=1 Tax=Blastomonas sp. RAC04 TaxID=1842535 RepID=UPI00083DAA11|nr:ethD domain protein [Blastomonas sp. RAC04]